MSPLYQLANKRSWRKKFDVKNDLLRAWEMRLSAQFLHGEYKNDIMYILQKYRIQPDF